MRFLSITVYHDTSGRFTTGGSGDTVREVISPCHELPLITEAAQFADWLFGLLNTDLELLRRARRTRAASPVSCWPARTGCWGFARCRSATLSPSAPEQPAHRTMVTAIGETVRTRRRG